MFGLFFSELQEFVAARFGTDAWTQMLAEGGLGYTVYLPAQAYPDEEFGTLVATASRRAGVPTAEVLESFGQFLAPRLLRAYGTRIDPTWRTLDVIEKTESLVHRAIRHTVPGAAPPRLATTRPSHGEVILEYTSRRRLCPVAIGIIKGTAQALRETVEVREDQCMLHGDGRCLISTRLVAG